MALYKKFLISIGFVALLGFSGCARYSAKPLKKHSCHPSRTSKDQSISLSYRLFSTADCKRYLGRNVLAKGYQPVLITLFNNSSQFFYTSYDSISLPCVSPEEVARSVHTSTAGRAVGYGLAGLVMWPLLIPAVVDGIGSSEANTLLDADFADKAFEKQQSILPYSTVSGLIFVDCDSFDENFTITATNSTTLNQVALSPTHSRINLTA